MKSLLIIAVILTAYAFTTPIKKNIDITESYITWTGKKILGSHTGTINIKEGYLEMEGDILQGGLFVVETVSVVMQVTSFRLTGRRIFRMAPLHHHYELKGWPEPRIIVRFWIITVVLVLIGLASLKVR